MSGIMRKRKRAVRTTKKTPTSAITAASCFAKVHAVDAFTEDAKKNIVFNAREGVLTMLDARGYDIQSVPRYSSLKAYCGDGNHAFEKHVRMDAHFTCARIQPLRGIAERRYNTPTAMHVWLVCNQKALSIKDFRVWLTWLETHAVHRAILVLWHEMTIDVRKALLGERARRWIEVFRMQELGVDILRHCLQPQSMSILSLRDAKKVVERYARDQPARLPLMLVRDPVARRLGALPGDLVQIERLSATGGLARTYRLVAHNPKTMQKLFDSLL